MKRAAIVVLWTFLLTFTFLFLCCVVAGVASAIVLEGDPAQNKAAIDEASGKWALPMFFGSALAAVAVSTMGLLPGTGRLAVTTGPGAPDDFDFADGDYPRARPIIALPLGTTEDPP